MRGEIGCEVSLYIMHIKINSPMTQMAEKIRKAIRDMTNDEMMRPSLKFCQPSLHVSE